MRVHNFTGGPAALPEAVLQRASNELMDFRGMGASVMEISHRSAEFSRIAEDSEAALRRLMDIPDDYAVLFPQGGATGQFAAIVLNLVKSEAGEVPCYVDTGYWASRAVKEAKRYGETVIVASSEAQGYREIPHPSTWNVPDNAAFLHVTLNETIGGVEFRDEPSSDVILVADASSNILSKAINVSRYGVIYAGAQKNLGPSGIAVTIIRKSLIGRGDRPVPTVLDYAALEAARSMANTPPVFAWYIAGLVFDWVESEGGVEVMAKRNARKAERLYGFLDENDFYQSKVAPQFRSRMNVPFNLQEESRTKAFLAAARDAGFIGLEGHRSVGGVRASLYNAIRQESVDALIDFLDEFAASAL
ncbi:MAG: 3-phosphoserine/phosphohydroxythreonine transaminase [Gammaproteobacteria bacterium]|nr:3-phosphoserine/phosphohydroxythreonine transaminase [Gammaproteobacteria bacterium]